MDVGEELPLALRGQWRFHFILHHSCLTLFFPPDAGKGGLDLVLEAGDQFAVGGHQRLLGFDFRHDGLLGGEGWEGDSNVLRDLSYELAVEGRAVSSLRELWLNKSLCRARNARKDSFFREANVVRN